MIFPFPYVLSVSANHKIIGISYLWLSYIFGLFGFYLSILIRGELGSSGSRFIAMDIVDIYNLAFTLHGIIMIFFNIMPGLFGGIGNYLFPILLGATDVVFPRANLYSLLLQPISFLLVISSICFELNGGTGWTMYPPLSTSLTTLGVDLIIIGLLISGISSIMSSLNFICTFSSLKCIGLLLDKQLPTSWSVYITSFLLLLTLPVLTSAFIMLLTDRVYNTMIFDPVNSGDPILYQHLFWIFGHPEVYVLILPAFGIISLILSCTTSKETFGNQTMIIAMASIALIGCLVWVHHMYTSGVEVDTRSYFTTTTILIALPTGNKIFNWICTVQNSLDFKNLGFIQVVVAFIFTFTLGGTTGVILGNAGVDIALHDTAYVVAHFHFVLSIGAIFALIAFISVIQRLMLDIIVTNRCLILLIPSILCSIILTFTPMHFLGFATLPRRIPDYGDEVWAWNILCSIGALMVLVLKVIFLYLVTL
uniref:Cytochrome c oxidase subunit 1 n=1 Tax=Babesia rodhaini TaxID=5870 RepID=K7ZP84_BABRO|nr:cytochrome oxidase subunit I [Babesia rodhaini]BAM68231.1 cytochrome oxidase subunit I [Babesia rodhaini]BAM68235.1 cytochrome oxidase subunit I [Babesia rodhaini]BAM68238.1 cytochrome oxidase subunit I [Babesia rodhaini]